MNFFGHAVVASWVPSPQPAVLALGAMLPDFAGMAGVTVPAEWNTGALGDGIALHHRTDAAFHPLPPVVALMRDLAERLTAAGVSRGPMRAVSHIGVELLLDGALARDEAACGLYCEALAVALPATGFDPLLQRLRSYGAPTDLADPTVVTTRVLRAIAHRPRLAASADEAAMIRRELTEFAPRVDATSGSVVRMLRAAMGFA